MKKDPVNHPAHYTHGKMEVIDILHDQLGPAEYQGFLHGNAIKYILRCKHKANPKQDIEKAIWYLTRYRDTL